MRYWVRLPFTSQFIVLICQNLVPWYRGCAVASKTTEVGSSPTGTTFFIKLNKQVMTQFW